MTTKTINFSVPMDVKIEQRGEWFYAESAYGQANSYSEEDCLRIIKERMMESVGEQHCR